MKLLTKLAFTAIALLGTLPTTFAGPRAEHARHEAKRQAQKEETAEKERRWSHYLTDAGALGPIGWKEYTVNPNAKGTPSLVVVLGGRDAIEDGPRPPQPPPALEKRPPDLGLQLGKLPGKRRLGQMQRLRRPRNILLQHHREKIPKHPNLHRPPPFFA